MTFDLANCLRDWRTDSIHNYPNLETAFGMPELPHKLELQVIPHWSSPSAILFPRTPEYNQVLLNLKGVRTRYYLGCFDPHVLERAIALGVHVRIHSEIFAMETYAHGQMEQGLWIDERYKIVRRHEYAREAHYARTVEHRVDWDKATVYEPRDN